MNNLFRKDITIKIISVLIAVLFWVYVSNTSNPFITKTFTNIPLKIENETFLSDSGYIIKNKYRTTVDVTIRGRQEAIDRVRTSDFEAFLDFSQIQSVNDKTLKITGLTCTQKDVTIVSTNPPGIDVQLARNRSGSFPVDLKTNITMKPGYTLVKTTVTPESFPIVAEESILDSVGSIKASLDIRNLDRDTVKTVPCKVYNTKGEEISSLSADLKVSVKLEVAKEVPVSLVTRGRLAADYVETLRVVNPVTVLLEGPFEVLDKLADIKTEQVDIDKLSNNLATSVSLIIPDGTKLVNNSQKEIDVNISVEKLAVRDIELLQGDISILNGNNDGSLSYEIKTEKLAIQVKGRQPDVDSILPESLRAAVDVSGLVEGTYKLPLNIKMPSQVKLLTQGTVEVKVTRSSTSPEPQTP